MVRGRRRQQGIRKVRRVLDVWRNIHWIRDADFYQTDGRLARLMLNTRVPCSGPCCGNPRKWFGEKTCQERRADEAETAELIDQILEERAEVEDAKTTTAGTD